MYPLAIQAKELNHKTKLYHDYTRLYGGTYIQQIIMSKNNQKHLSFILKIKVKMCLNSANFSLVVYFQVDGIRLRRDNGRY